MTHIIIGAGHNALVCAAYLARAGRKIQLIEQRDRIGGQLATEQFAGGEHFAPLHPAPRLRPDILRELGLPVPASSMRAPHLRIIGDDGRTLLLGDDPLDALVLDSIRAFSTADARRWPEFLAFMQGATQWLDAAYRTPMPRLENKTLLETASPLLSLGLKMRRMGRQRMFALIRMLAMSVDEFTAEWFESEAIRAALCSLGIHGSNYGPMAQGTALVLLHNWLNRGGIAHRVEETDTARLLDALHGRIVRNGGEIRTGCAVSRIRVEHSRATGVELADGEFLRAERVISGADPRSTLLGLVGTAELSPDFVWQLQSLRMRGNVSMLHLLTDGRHGLPPGTCMVAPSVKYLERAADAAKYGQLPEQPCLEITSSGNIVSVHVQGTPMHLRQDDWSGQAAQLERIALETLAPLFPALGHSIIDKRLITPSDMQRTWGLEGGQLDHGELALDQVFFMRPLPGCSDHRTPIAGLYLCGSGVHGGGGISGGAGRNAALRVLGEPDNPAHP